MATNNSVNSPLSGTTGTGKFVGDISPTLTTPNVSNTTLASTATVSRTATFPDLTGTVALSGANQTVTFNSISTNILQSTQNASNTTFTGTGTLSNSLYPNSTTYTELAGIDFVDTGGTLPYARIAAYKTGGGSLIKMGTSNNYGSGITNTAIQIDQSGILTLSSALPVGSGGTGVTTSTGTGSTVLSTSPTLTTPRTAQINDTNGNANLAIAAAASAVNYMTSVNSATGGFTGFEVTGTDTNANAYMKPKGDAGFAVITSAVSAVPFAIYSGTGQQHVTTFTFSNTNATRAVTFPDRTASVNMGLATGGIQAWVNFNGTATPITITGSSNVTSITDGGVGVYTVNFTNALASATYSAVATNGYVAYITSAGSTLTTTACSVEVWRRDSSNNAADATPVCFAAIL
jgi:hypothetical protein